MVKINNMPMATPKRMAGDSIDDCSKEADKLGAKLKEIALAATQVPSAMAILTKPQINPSTSNTLMISTMPKSTMVMQDSSLRKGESYQNT